MSSYNVIIPNNNLINKNRLGGKSTRRRNEKIRRRYNSFTDNPVIPSRAPRPLEPHNQALTRPAPKSNVQARSDSYTKSFPIFGTTATEHPHNYPAPAPVYDFNDKNLLTLAGNVVVVPQIYRDTTEILKRLLTSIQVDGMKHAAHNALHQDGDVDTSHIQALLEVLTDFEKTGTLHQPDEAKEETRFEIIASIRDNVRNLPADRYNEIFEDFESVIESRNINLLADTVVNWALGGHGYEYAGAVIKRSEPVISVGSDEETRALWDDIWANTDTE